MSRGPGRVVAAARHAGGASAASRWGGSSSTEEKKPRMRGIRGFPQSNDVASGSGYARTLITTRRFCARPSRVLLAETGFSSP